MKIASNSLYTSYNIQKESAKVQIFEKIRKKQIGVILIKS